MELTQDKIQLIEKIIRNDRKFVNNEDLYEDFFNEMCKRSIPIVNTITSDVTLEAYLRKIATTSIVNVLKDSGRLRRTREGYSAVKTVAIVGQNETSRNYSDAKIEYNMIDFESNPEDIAVKNEILQKVIDSVYTIQNAEPDKQYLKIYKLRYDEGMTQKEIAQELNLSQAEISKRLFKLMEKVKKAFN